MVIKNTSGLIVRAFKVNRKRSSQEAINATGCKQYVDKTVLATIPMDGADKGRMTFLKLDRHVSDKKLAVMLEAHGLKPDPIAQIAINEASRVFAINHPNGTHWPRPGGGYNFLTFGRRGGKCSVSCNSFREKWSPRWWIGGVPK